MTKSRHIRQKPTEKPLLFDFGVRLDDVAIMTEAGRAAFETQFATVYDVMEAFNCAIATAYRYMRQLPRYRVTDRSGERLREYQAVRRSDLLRIHRGTRGNPNFLRSSYQRKLRLRRR